jgi:hypothetical protein
MKNAMIAAKKAVASVHPRPLASDCHHSESPSAVGSRKIPRFIAVRLPKTRRAAPG